MEQVIRTGVTTVFFDLDGTILDSETKALGVLRRIIPEYLGRDVNDSELADFKGVPWLEVLEGMFPGREYEIYDRVLKEWDRTPTEFTVYGGVVDAIRDLAETGYTIGLVSSKETRYIVDDLTGFDIMNFFSVVVGSTDTVRHKPHPEPLLEASRRLSKKPENCIYVGDQPTDILAAKAARMLSAAALWGEGTYDLLNEARPDFLFKTPSEILPSLSGRRA